MDLVRAAAHLEGASGTEAVPVVGGRGHGISLHPRTCITLVCYRLPGHGGTLTAVATPPDAEVEALARRIADLGAGERTRVFRMSWWSERMLDWAMERPGFKTQLFRFV
ncbi:MAG: hypothetical protein ACRDJP_00155, partial [Actinomycetota bacterium]